VFVLDDLRNEIKSYIIKSGWSMKDLVDEINKRYDKSTSLSNLSNKLSRGTIKYSEVKEIANIIGYDIEWIEKKD